MKKIYFLLSLAFFCAIAFNNMAQVSTGGNPLSTDKPKWVTSTLIYETMPAIDLQKLAAEDAINDNYKDVPWRFGENFEVTLNPKNSGVWDLLPTGDKVWRLGIKCPGAFTINLTFDKYHLPPGASLFVYNAQKSFVIGAFTEENNQKDGVFATTLVKGDEIVVEYYEPANVPFSGELNIWRVTHGYRDAYGYAESFGSSGSCNNNVFCPESVGWENQIKSVCMLVSGGSGFCSGALVNNVNSNGIPYILTANHCYSDPSSWVFWFNWQSPTCTNPSSSPPYNSMSGATLKSRYSDSDFCLVQINSAPPSSYGVYYSGWNREDVAATSGAGIHHPSGDIKKISYSILSYVSDTWSGTPANSHWHVYWNDGVTEPGSSGSPIYDQNKRIVGQLHGGPSSCTATDKSDYYGKFSMSWNQGTTAATRLRDWLDPSNTSGLTLEGYDPNGTPIANFIANSTSICPGGSVTFTDQSSGAPTSWSWSFPGGSPSSYSGQTPPPISYAAVGNYDVTLTVSNALGSDSETKTGYISVKNIVANFSGTPTTVVVGSNVTFTDLSSCNPTAWSWSFPGGTPSSATGAGPHIITYNTLGTYDVSLTVTKPGATDTKTATGYITVISPEFNMTNGTVTTCTGNFYDSGGASANYVDNENYTETFYPSTPGSMIRFVFNSFNTESGYDYLRIYNGTSTSAPLIGTYNGTTGPGTVTASNASGALTFNFTSDGSVTYAGWSASITCYSTTQPPVADFSASTTTPALAQTVTFTDLSSNYPTSWSWTFNPNTITYVSGTSSTSQNPQVQFNALGYYTVTLTATNSYGSDSETKSNYINVINCSYCTTSFSNLSDDWISNVTFNTINNSSGSTTYSNFTALSTNVIPGSSYPISVNVTVTGSWIQHAIVWIDWNQNCTFGDTGETFDLGQTPGTAGTFTLSGTVIVPSSALAGSTRMRVSERYNQDPGACDVATYGEPEDYSVIVGSDLKTDITVYLEGPYNGSGMNQGMTGFLPLNQPYNVAPWNYTGTENVASFPANTVDWVLIELRDATSAALATSGTRIARKAVFIRNDGKAMDISGSTTLNFGSLSVANNLFVVVLHRNHLSVLSANALTQTSGIYTYNFATSAGQAYLNGQKNLGSGVYGMYGGDGDKNGTINVADESPTWEVSAGTQGYLSTDYNLDTQSNNLDKDNIWSPNLGAGSQVPN